MKDDELIRELLTRIYDTKRDFSLAQACLALLGEEPEKPSEPEKKPEPKTPAKKTPAKKAPKPFDLGKLKALSEGGWPVAKIADEMGVSEATIYNKLKKLQEVQD